MPVYGTADSRPTVDGNTVDYFCQICVIMLLKLADQ